MFIILLWCRTTVKNAFTGVRKYFIVRYVEICKQTRAKLFVGTQNGSLVGTENALNLCSAILTLPARTYEKLSIHRKHFFQWVCTLLVCLPSYSGVSLALSCEPITKERTDHFVRPLGLALMRIWSWLAYLLHKKYSFCEPYS